MTAYDPSADVEKVREAIIGIYDAGELTTWEADGLAALDRLAEAAAEHSQCERDFEDWRRLAHANEERAEEAEQQVRDIGTSGQFLACLERAEAAEARVAELERALTMLVAEDDAGHVADINIARAALDAADPEETQ